jgi:hypothetical protein
VIAQPLSEQEAQDELAMNRASVEAKREAIVARRVEKESMRAEKAARKAAEKAARKQAGQSQNVSFSLSTAGMVCIAGLICVVVLAAFSIGRHSKDEFGRLGTVAGIVNKPAQQNASPSSGKKGSLAEAGLPKIPATVHPELSELLKKPETKTGKSVKTNEPIAVTGDDAATSTLPENLNYLQIESFLITRERNGEQLAADLSHVRKFLSDRGVRTFARKRSNAYILFCEQGVAPGKEHAQDRDSLRRKIQQLGQEYRASGGQYQFKGCLFVSYNSTKAGDPV